MPYYQSNTLKHALCSSSSPLRRGGGEVLERVCSKLGGGFDKAIVPVDSPVVAIEGPYATRAGELQDMVLRNIDCASLNAEYSLIDRHFSIIDDLKTVNNQENDLYFYHSDHLGSSSFITDADGIVSQHLQYLPYGELFAEQRDNTARYYTPYKFSGKEKDEETGYSYFGARYYMSDVSVWLSVDPMADKYPYQTPYSYCGSRPINVIDPNGTSEVSPDEYGVNDKGEVKFLKAKEGPDELYKIDNNGNKVDVDNNGKMEEGTDYVKLSDDAAKNYQHQDGEFWEGNQPTRDFTKISNTKIAETVFKFLSKNTNVEWLLVNFKRGKTIMNLLVTSHEEGACNSTDLITYYQKLGWDVVKNIHNHPRNSEANSGWEGDLGAGEEVKRRSPNATFYIYTKKHDRYKQYEIPQR